MTKNKPRYASSFLLAILVTIFLICLMPLLLQLANPPQKDENRDAIALIGAIKLKEPPPKKKVKRKEPKPPPKVNPKLKEIMPKFDSASLLDVPFQFDMGLSSDIGDEDMSLGFKIWNEQDVDVKPVALFRAKPVYPAQAMAKNITGKVTFKLLVDKDGTVKEVKIIEANPPGVFEEATVKSVHQWRFQPAKVKGEPVSAWCQSAISYELDYE